MDVTLNLYMFVPFGGQQVSHHSQRMGGINCVALSQDETTVLTVGQEKRVTYWDLREHHPVAAKVKKRATLAQFRSLAQQG